MRTTHRRHRGTIGHAAVVQFASDDSNSHYGPHVWTLVTELPMAWQVPGLVSFAAKFYNVDEEIAEDLVNPRDIVENAKAWDDLDFVCAVVEALPEFIGCSTCTGAVVVDLHEVDLVYSFEG